MKLVKTLGLSAPNHHHIVIPCCVITNDSIAEKDG